MDQINIVQDSLKKIVSVIVCFIKPITSNFLKAAFHKFYI